MGMPLDLYVIRHGESEANVIISAGEQGDNSLYTQDNVTVPDRSWRLTATGRKQADCIGRWLVSQQQLFDRYMVSPYVRTRETAATMALPKAKWEENRVLRERSWGEINTITKDDFKTNYARNWMFKNTDPLYWRPPAGESIADVAENRVAQPAHVPEPQVGCGIRGDGQPWRPHAGVDAHVGGPVRRGVHASSGRRRMEDHQLHVFPLFAARPVDWAHP